MRTNHDQHAFTLIELLVVIMIVAVLMGLAFPAFQKVQESAKKTQAKNDLVQIVTAVNAYQTEYGKYPLPSGASGDTYTYAPNNNELFDSLRGTGGDNPRKIPFMEIRPVKDFSQPRGGISGDGKFYDPFGMPFSIAIDSDYNHKIANPYTNAGFATLDLGVIAYSSGKNKKQDSDAKAPGFDDILSWQ